MMDFPLLRRFEHDFEFVWPHDNRTLSIEWTRRGGEYFFRPKGAEVGLIWHCFEGHGIRAPGLILADSLRFSSLYRVVPLGEEGRVLWHRRGAIWVKSGQEPGQERGAHFEIPAALSNKKIGHKQLFFEVGNVLQEFYGQTKDESSDLNRARVWLDNFLKSDWKEWASLELKSPERLEIMQLLKALIAIFEANPAVTRKFSFFERASCNQVRIRCTNSSIPPVCFEVLNSHYNIVLNNRLRVLYFSDWGSATHCFPRLELGSETTQHERLEALLLWRDFLKGKMPPGEIETLLQ